VTFLDSVLTRVPVDEINREARDIHFWRTVATLLAGLLFAVGWLVAKTFTVLWLAVAWTATAVKVGYQAGRPSPPVS
jgi:hypothetical protein